MKFYIRLFIISLIAFSLLFVGGWNIFIKNQAIDTDIVATPNSNYVPDVTLPGVVDLADDKNDHKDDEIIISKTELEILVEESNRVNFTVFAHDGLRADTIMFVSFDPDTKKLDIINIPRDTYWLVEGYTERADHKKINSVYGHAGDVGGSAGLKQAIADMLKVPVHYYVKFDYNGAAAVVDVMGGVEIDVPFKMDYDDPYAKPELHIHLEEGLQLLDGKNSVDYLRWRQNNDDVASAGDLPRISRMQGFIKNAMKKAIGLRLPSVVSTGFRYVQSDIKANLAISYADDAIGISSSDISTYRLPGDAPATSSYYIGDPEKINELLIDVYSYGKEEE